MDSLAHIYRLSGPLGFARVNYGALSGVRIHLRSRLFIRAGQRIGAVRARVQLGAPTCRRVYKVLRGFTKSRLGVLGFSVGLLGCV